MNMIRSEPALKVIGADFELANSLIRPDGVSMSTYEAACWLLDEIPGFPRGTRGGTAIEFDRRFVMTSGGSWYIDSNHLEGNLPEHSRAFDHAKILHGAGLRQARLAQISASNRLQQGDATERLRQL